MPSGLRARRPAGFREVAFALRRRPGVEEHLRNMRPSDPARFQPQPGSDLQVPRGKWGAEYSPFFTGKHVVVFPDNDTPGDEHARLLRPYSPMSARYGLFRYRTSTFMATFRIISRRTPRKNWSQKFARLRNGSRSRASCSSRLRTSFRRSRRKLIGWLMA